MRYIVILLLIVWHSIALSQSLQVFDIDTTDFPIMRAKFFATDINGHQLTDLDESDFRITENGEERIINSISCPESVRNDSLSILFSFDISGSMGENPIEKSKEFSQFLLDRITVPPDEVALQTCNDKSSILLDFSTDKTKISEVISSITTGGSNDFIEQLMNQKTGAIVIAQSGKFKKHIILLTDGFWKKMSEAEEAECIKLMQTSDIIFHCLVFEEVTKNNDNVINNLEHISYATGGVFRKNIITRNLGLQLADFMALNILDDEPCIIEWVSEYSCGEQKSTLNFQIPGNNVEFKSNYSKYNEQTHLLLSPPILNLVDEPLNIKCETIVNITAIYDDIVIDTILCSNSSFEIRPTSFFIEKGNSTNIFLSFTPKDKNYLYTRLRFVGSDLCWQNYEVTAYYTGVESENKTLEITHPNGEEKFLIGSDTLINWQGISSNDRVKIEFSSDSGDTWKNLSLTANNLSYEWNNIPHETSDNCLIKVSSMYDLPQWQKRYGGSYVDNLRSVIQTDDHGYIMAGTSQSVDGDVSGNYGSQDWWIVKTDSLGNIEWEQNYGGTERDWVSEIVQTKDRGYIIAGRTYSSDIDVKHNYGASDCWVVKIDSVGKIEWEKCFGGSKEDEARSVIETSDGEYIVVGYATSDDGLVQGSHNAERGLGDIWILKIDKLGNIKWQQCYGGTGRDSPASIEETHDKGFVIAGYTGSMDGDIGARTSSEGIFVFKLDMDGTIVWKKMLGIHNAYTNCYDVHQTSDGGYIVLGYLESFWPDAEIITKERDCWIHKLDKDGNIEWVRLYGGDKDDLGRSICETEDKGFIIVGYSESNPEHKPYSVSDDLWAFKLDQNGFKEWEKYFEFETTEEGWDVHQTHDKGYIIAGSPIRKQSSYDYWLIKLFSDDTYIQSDTSDAVFSIVKPEVSSQDIYMGKAVINKSKDSVVVDFIENIGQWQCRIDTIYFQGADSEFFSLNGPHPIYTVAVGAKQMSEFKFSPTEIRDYAAEIVIITQSDTLYQTISGTGDEETILSNPDIIDFGIVDLYKTKDSLVTLIRNVATKPIEITKIEMLGPDKEQFIFNDLTQIQAFTLAGNTDYSLNLRFNPKYMGRTSGQVAFHFDGAGSPAIAQLYGAGIGAELSASTDTAYVGDVIGIDISFDNNDIAKFAEVIGSFEGVVRVESSILGALHKEDLVEIKADSAYIKFKGEINSASNIIATIPLKVALGRVESTCIDFEYVKWFDTEGNEIVYDTEFTSGFFKQLGICEEGGKRFFNPDGIVGISNLSPNPAENRIQIDFSVIEAGYTEITLVNMLGKTVATFFAEDISDFQDRQIIKDVTDIGSGQYILQFKTPTYIEIRKLIILK